MAWAVLQYSRGRVDAAGRYLIQDEVNWHAQDAIHRWVEATTILDNWRASHNFPLNTFQVSLRQKARTIDKSALVAQRLKRIPSIVAKLGRFPKMSLSRMQDIGGCRAVVGSVTSVERLRESYLESSFKHELLQTQDYIVSPKPSGYRGVHLIYRYKSDRNETYNNHRIELQIRSRLQHSWATAVETVGTLIGQALKSSEGEGQWLEFFQLVSSAFAEREGQPLLIGAPEYVALVRQIKEMCRSLRVVDRLNGFRTAIKESLENAGFKKTKYYLMVLDPGGQKIFIKGYAQQELTQANKDYLDQERANSSKTGIDAVLVSADSLFALRDAYPNYFGDTQHFLMELDRVLRS